MRQKSIKFSNIKTKLQKRSTTMIIHIIYQGKKIKLDNINDYLFKIDPSLKHIDNEAFKECSFIDQITIPPFISSIGSSSFFGCNSLTQIILPPSVIEICENAFIGTSIQSISIPSKVLYIGHSAFESCKNLRSVSFPYNSELKIIEFNCFFNISVSDGIFALYSIIDAPISFNWSAISSF